MSKKAKASKNKAEDVETKQVQPALPRQQVSNMQALQFIDGCVSRAPLNRSEHVNAQQALRQLSGVIGELDRLKAKKE